MSSPTLDFAVYVGGECMACFVHTPDAAHYRQQLIHRICDEAPDRKRSEVAAGVTVNDAPRSPVRRQDDGLPVQVWLVWDGQQLLGVHSTREGGEAAREWHLVRLLGDALDATTSVVLTTACVVDES